MTSQKNYICELSLLFTHKHPTFQDSVFMCAEDTDESRKLLELICPWGKLYPNSYKEWLQIYLKK